MAEERYQVPRRRRVLVVDDEFEADRPRTQGGVEGTALHVSKERNTKGNHGVSLRESTTSSGRGGL